MVSRKQLIIENLTKHAIILVIAFFFWVSIYNKIKIADESVLSSIGVMVGMIALASLAAYFSFSFSIVSKDKKIRTLGYLATFFLFLAFVVSIEVILATAIVWIPDLSFVWIVIVGSLFIGSIIYDNLDLMRIGLDTAAVSFFEKGDNKKSNDVQFFADKLKEGQRLSVANATIGQAIVSLGEEKKIKTWVKGGEWIIDNAEENQHLIDHKVAELFEHLAKDDKRIEQIASDLKKGQNQSTADTLIGRLLEIINK